MWPSQTLRCHLCSTRHVDRSSTDIIPSGYNRCFSSGYEPRPLFYKSTSTTEQPRIHVQLSSSKSHGETRVSTHIVPSVYDPRFPSGCELRFRSRTSCSKQHVIGALDALGASSGPTREEAEKHSRMKVEGPAT